mgnify:CR=1 FL=1|tara:strand:+ start:47 stop:652 length:606 start_codon:yes stop_codon:yes gene_type:complete
MEEQLPVHINIYKDNQNSIDTSSNRSETYIILANEALNNTNRDLLGDLAEVKAERDTFEEENERMEKSITYQRGLLHNFNTLNKLEINNSNKEQQINKLYQDQAKEKEKFISKVLSYCGIIILLQTSFGLLDPMVIISLLANICSVVYISTRLHPLDNSGTINKSFNYKISTLKKDIEKNHKEIKSITDSSDFISDFIEVL